MFQAYYDERFLPHLQHYEPPAALQVSTWYVQLDDSALDLELRQPSTTAPFHLDLSAQTIKVAWKDMLSTFAARGVEVRKRFAKENHREYTFSREEDCVREVRRKRFYWDARGENDEDSQRLRRVLSNIRPLFGRERLVNAVFGSVLHNTCESIEDRCMEVIMGLHGGFA
jgi:hypothetical protein